VEKMRQPLDEVTAAKIRAFYSGHFVFEAPAPRETREVTAEREETGEVHPDEIPVMCPVLPEKNPAVVRRRIFAEKMASNGCVGIRGIEMKQ
jgi:hypothetical protein